MRVAEGGGEGQTADAHSATPDVFISYASQDAAVASAVVAALERHGLKCWIALQILRVAWSLDPIRNEPEFKAVEARMNFPP
jgi:hypothetical protein